MVAAITDATNVAGTGNRPASSRLGQRMLQAIGRRADAHDPRVIRETASQLVSELFFKPLLSEVREFPFGQEIGTGGQTESIFGSQLDQRIADSVAAADNGLVDQIVRQLEPHTPGVAGADRAWWPAQVASMAGAEEGKL